MPRYCDADGPLLLSDMKGEGRCTIEKLVFVDEITDAEVD
jgi:hypothetical protein